MRHAVRITYILSALPLHTRILIGLAVGIVAGSLSRLFFGEHPALLQFTTYVAEPVGRLFMRLIFMLVVPLLFSALALGIAGLGDVRTLGRIGFKTFLYTFGATSALGSCLGLTLVNVFRPGDGLSAETRAALQQANVAPTPPCTLCRQ